MNTVDRAQLKQRIEAIVPPMPGWCSVEKALAMAELIIDTDANTVVELGVFGGRSLVPQALALKVLCGLYAGMPSAHPLRPLIYGIDPWSKEACLEGENDKANDEWWAKLDLEEIHRGCMRAIRENNLDMWVTIMRTKGENVVGLFKPGSIDILHIDGNHSELSSTRDVDLWLPLVKQGGYIWMDDTDWPTTKKAVDMLTEACDVVKDVGACRLFHKR